MENSSTESFSTISKSAENSPTTKKQKNKRWFKLGTRFAIVPETLLLDESLTNSEKLIIIALALHHNHKSGTCTPSRKTISKICGLSPNKVSEATTKLTKLGWLDIQRRGSTSSQYILHDPQCPIVDVQLATKTPLKPYEYKGFSYDEDADFDDEPF